MTEDFGWLRFRFNNGSEHDLMLNLILTASLYETFIPPAYG